MSLYEKIREENKGFYGTKYKNTTSLVINQYNDRTHFIFELIQNAEDSGAENVLFFLCSDCLIIEHDGNVFNETDIRSICALGESSKAKERSGIGKFGIGFKSVYAYTQTPQIHSGCYDFEIHDCIFPEKIAPTDHNDKKTIIRLPFNHDDVSPSTAYEEINSALETQLTESSVLMLNNISSISIKTASFSAKIVTERESISDDRKVNNIKVSYYKNEKKLRAQTYYQFTDNEKYASVVMFRYEGSNIIKTDAKDNYIYSYFPTSVESHQNFLIQAPFNTTPARDNIKLNENANIQFIKNICQLIEYSFIWFRDNKKITLKALSDVYPVYQYDNRNIFYPIYSVGVDIINNEKIIPTCASGEYNYVKCCYIADNAGIVDLIDNYILRTLTDYTASWMDKDIIKTEHHSFYQYICENFAVSERRLRLRQLVDRMDERFYTARNVKWFEKLFLMISNQPSDFRDKVKKYPFIRLSTGDHIAPYDGGNAVVYLNNPKECANEIDHDFLSNEVIRKFYQTTLGLEEYNIVNYVLDKILPRYSSGKNTVNISENIQDLVKVVNALHEDSSNRIINKLQNSYIIYSNGEWFLPKEVNIPIGFSKYKEFISLFCTFSDIIYMDDRYFSTQNQIKTEDYIMIGCKDDVKYICMDRNEYIDLANQYTVENVFSNTMPIRYYSVCDHLENVLKNADKKTSMYIARYFDDKISDDYILSFFRNNKKYVTAIGIFLNYIPWLYTNEGVKKAAHEMKKEELDDKYCCFSNLLNNLSFMEANEELRKMIEVSVSGSQKDLLLRLLDSPEESKEIERILKKRDRKNNRAAESAVSPMDMLNGLVKKQQGDGNGIDGYEPEPLYNPERRKTKIQKEFEESCNKVVSVIDSCSLRFSYLKKTDNKEERENLFQHYSGRCQICGNTIVDYKNHNYFEAINIISTDDMPIAYQQSKRGWNSLSLCPNCAVKIKVCSKDLSDFSRQILEFNVEDGYDEYIPVKILLKGELVEINYTPKHFFELKAALEYFKNNY